MADNAIEKLFEEIRQAHRAIEDAEQAREDAHHALADAAAALRKAKYRAELLDETLRRHVHDNVPIVQAKMIAHEEQAEREKQGSLIVGGSINASKIQANSITAAKITGTSVLGGPTWFNPTK